jgi:hypothetical protein
MEGWRKFSGVLPDLHFPAPRGSLAAPKQSVQFVGQHSQPSHSCFSAFSQLSVLESHWQASHCNIEPPVSLKPISGRRKD